MDTQEIVDLFSSPEGARLAKDYLAAEGLAADLEANASRHPDKYRPHWADLARLHAVVRGRKAFTILEYGIGYSTWVMADALMKNRRDWDALADKPRIRNATPFQLHSVDASAPWIEIAREAVPERLRPLVTCHHSPVTAGTFQDRACHYYEKNPDVVADFIYLDGPDPADVEGRLGGIGWANPDRVVMGADLLRAEPWLLPGTCVLVDGRTANARFLQAHFFRDWAVARNTHADVTAMELKEAPLGAINSATLDYCLGARARSW